MDLFRAVVEQVATQLAASIQVPSAMRVLASYFARVYPEVDGKPFCVALSECTFLYHMKMNRIPTAHVDLYAQLIMDCAAQIPTAQLTTHPFMTVVLHDAVFGLPSPTCETAHSVVLLPVAQFRAFAHLATVLALHDGLPDAWLVQWHRQLTVFSQATSPMVSHRAAALLTKTSPVVQEEQVRELHNVLKAKRATMNIDHILTCYERLQRVVVDPEQGSTKHRALSIHCSEIFLKFRSPVRKVYTERFLFPSLCHPDTESIMYHPGTREHLTRRLLRLCVPDMRPTNPYYMSLCAIVHREMSDEQSASLELIRLMRSQMPHAAYFIGTLGLDTNMSMSTFAKSLMVLNRAAGLAMTGRSEDGDDVAQLVNNNPIDVYNIVFCVRELVRLCASSTSRRSDDLMVCLKKAMPVKTIEALGKLSTQAFEDHYELVLAPSLLCAELGMVVHELNIDEAVDASIDHLRGAPQSCDSCGGSRCDSSLCPVDGTLHLGGHAAARRVLSTLCECAGGKSLERKLISLFRDPKLQHECAVHMLFYHILSNAGHRRQDLFRAIEPYARNTLVTIAAMDRSVHDGSSNDAISLVKANVIVLHTKLAVLMRSVIDATYIQSILKIFADLQLRNNHDALVVWNVCNHLLRNGREHVELLAMDPAHCNYANGFPACAPANVVAADNAQLLLQMLDRTLHCSVEMQRLTGATVCKLIQDFNVQTPNIVSSLLSPCGFVPVSLEPLNELALPIGKKSTFWSFITRQMRSSAPARTALMTSLARCMSLRFRNHNPADAVSLSTREPTGHVFTVMMYEAMRRNPSLTRHVLHLMTSWLKQKKHLPGKFTCLAYCCVELTTTLLHRHDGADEMEQATEPAEERQQFTEAVLEAVAAIDTQLERMDRLLPEVSHNPTFCWLLKKIHLKARLVVSEATKRPLVTTEFDDELLEEDHAASRINGVSTIHTADRGSTSRGPSVALSEADMNEISLGDLQNPEDDAVFSADGDEGSFGDAAYDDDDSWSNNDAKDGGLNGLAAEEARSRALSVAASSSSLHRSHTTSLGPSISLRPPHAHDEEDGPRPRLQAPSIVVPGNPLFAATNTRSRSVSKGTQTAHEVATNTSFDEASSEGAQSAAVQTSAVLNNPAETKAADASTRGSKKKGGQYFFKNTAPVPLRNFSGTRNHALAASDAAVEQPADASTSSSSDDGSSSSSFIHRVESGVDTMRVATSSAHHRPAHAAGFGNFHASRAALAILTQAQNADSLIDDFHQVNQQQQGAPNAMYEALPVQHALAHVAVSRSNNYDVPHARRAPEPSSVVIAPVAVRHIEDHPMSKRRRKEGDMTFALPRLQGGGHAALMAAQRDDGDLAAMQAASASRARQHHYGAEYEDAMYATPHHAHRGQLDQALVEQFADSTLRDMALMTRGNTNMHHAGSSGKKRLTGQHFDGSENDMDGRWNTLSSAPMPGYAEDRRYSMEL